MQFDEEAGQTRDPYARPAQILRLAQERRSPRMTILGFVLK